MTSILRTLQAEWNTLVPAAQARGIPRVRRLNAPLETIAYRRSKLEWLKAQLQSGTAFETLTFGVELEFLPTSQSAEHIAAAIRAAGIDCQVENYNHTTRSGSWKIVTDGSLGWNGREVVSPPLRGEDGFRQLRTVCQVLKANGARINSRCGFHVHVGAQGQPASFFRRLVKLYSSAQDGINRVLAPSRHNNGYCRRLVVAPQTIDNCQDVAQVAQAIGQTPSSPRGSGRYRVVNLQSYWQHGTVEFRQHQGTVEASKAENWVRLCLRMCLMAQKEEKTPRTLADLLDAVEVDQAERTYFLGREVYLQNRAQRRAA